MKPASIRRFDLFFLGSLALSLVDYLIERSAVVASMQAEAQAAGVALSSAVADGSFAFWMALMVLLWFLASSRRSTVAKWIIVLLVVVSLWGLPGLFTGPFTTAKIISLLSFLFSWVALFYLFRPDAKAWFSGRAADEPTDSATGG